MGIRILYAFDDRVPSPKADREQLVNTAAALARRGVDVTLFLPRVAPLASAEEIRRFYAVGGSFRVERYGSFPRPRGLQKLWSAVRTALSSEAGSADIFHTRNLPIAFAAAARGLPVVFEHYRPWPDQYPVLVPALRRLMRSSSFLGAILHSRLARRSYERIGVPEERLLVAHNGYEPERLRPALGREEARALLGLPRERPLAVYTGRVARDKGLDVVLDMARRRPEVLFLLVGAETDRRFAAEARAIPNVRLVAWQPYRTVARYLYAADVLVSPPSLVPLREHGNTVLPLKLFGYLPAGRPILAPRAEDVEELLVDGENARLVPPGDAEACVTALDGLLADPGLRERLEKGARRTARDLTWDARARRIHAFLRERLAGTGRRLPTPAGPPIFARRDRFRALVPDRKEEDAV